MALTNEEAIKNCKATIEKIKISYANAHPYLSMGRETFYENLDKQETYYEKLAFIKKELDDMVFDEVRFRVDYLLAMCAIHEGKTHEEYSDSIKRYSEEITELLTAYRELFKLEEGILAKRTKRKKKVLTKHNY